MKAIKLLLVIFLLAVAVMAVLSVTYPEMQEGFIEFFVGLGERILAFFRLFTEPFKEAFLRR